MALSPIHPKRTSAFTEVTLFLSKPLTFCSWPYPFSLTPFDWCSVQTFSIWKTVKIIDASRLELLGTKTMVHTKAKMRFSNRRSLWD